MKVNDLPHGIKELAEFRHDPGYDSDFKTSNSLGESFDWEKTPEHHDFWIKIYKCNFEPFYKLYGKEPNERWFWMEKEEESADKWETVKLLYEKWHETKEKNYTLIWNRKVFKITTAYSIRVFEGDYNELIKFLKSELTPKPTYQDALKFIEDNEVEFKDGYPNFFIYWAHNHWFVNNDINMFAPTQKYMTEAKCKEFCEKFKDVKPF